MSCYIILIKIYIQDSDEKKATSTNPTTTVDDDIKSKKDVDDKDKVGTTEKKDDTAVVSIKKEKEPDSEILHNPTRVVKAQVCFLFRLNI